MPFNKKDEGMESGYQERFWSKPIVIDMDKHADLPYVNAVAGYAGSRPLSLMAPAHNLFETGVSRELANIYGENTVDMDVPVLIEGVDLGADSGLAKARELAAEAWGAKRTWFMTNGASQANRTAAFAVRSLGQNVLMQRSSHSSFIDGILLSGLKPQFVLPEIDTVNGAAHGVSPVALERAFAESGVPIHAVYIISPSYFGSTSDVEKLADVAHSHGAALIVDNAWGAHFGFHPELPETPARLGADLVVSSTHKLAGSFGQSAMLHLADGPFYDALLPHVERAFTMTSSTSLNSLLLGSLDVARRSMVQLTDQIGESIRLANKLRDWVRADARFSLLSETYGEFSDIVAVDPLRISIDVSRTGATGHEFSGLCKKHGLYFEMSTATVVVAVIGATATPDIDTVVKIMDRVACELSERGIESRVDREFPQLPPVGKLQVLPRDAYFSKTEIVSAAEAVGRVSVDSLAAYPPGIPNVIPGEIITQELVDFLGAVAASSTGYVRGAADPLVQTYRVIAE